AFDQLIPAARAAFYRIDADLLACDFQLRGLGPQMHIDYLNHYRRLDPLQPAACLATGLPVVPLAVGMAQQPAAQRERYRSFLQRHGVIDVVEVIAADQGRPLAGLSLLRRVGEAPFSVDELNRLGALQTLLELAAQALPRGNAALDPLTPREREIALLLRDGASNKDLARQLGLGLATVKTHLIHLFRKAGVASRTELIARLFLDQPSG
ncbi:helix-turn-helix transcriptional regulator, partial [Pseudomonas citronellolis]|uniref:helix-turn-helix transcriptional regulator n=1 Tax=Pseudomonas citronellolis TaxID=53408 RepID=UPI0023E3BB66